MGVLNVTPDSFADAERFSDVGRAIDAGLRMEAEGADLIDVGGESTRPGAEPVGAGDEVAGGVPADRILIDPGIGFAKQAIHSYGLLARLPELAAALDRPIVVGPS